MSAIPATRLPAKASDFASNCEVRWCPGCGDYSILAQVKKVLAKLGVDRAQTAFISGIGRLTDPWGDLVNYFRDISLANVKYKLLATTTNQIAERHGSNGEPEGNAPGANKAEAG